jgi:hypothetical protein
MLKLRRAEAVGTFAPSMKFVEVKIGGSPQLSGTRAG